MCNENRRRVALDLIVEGFSQLRIPLRFPEGMPNLEPLDSIRITDRNAIVRAPANDDAAPPGAAELELAGGVVPGRPDPRTESATPLPGDDSSSDSAIEPQTEGIVE